MKCIACNKDLNDYESTRKDSEGHYIDMCSHCYNVSKGAQIELEDELKGVRYQDKSFLGG